MSLHTKKMWIENYLVRHKEQSFYP